MKKLLEPQSLRKLDILFDLSSTFEPQNMNELASDLNINIRTLLSTIDEINSDAEHFQQDITIERHSQSDLILNVSNNFSFFAFKLRYLKESILYQLLDSTFTHSHNTLQTLVEANHLSSASLYRKLPRLKEALHFFDLEFDARHHLQIKGNEKQIRFFFFNFYWYSVQLFEWPFTSELKELCSLLYDEIFKEQFEIKTVLGKEKIILWFAINIIRIQGGYHLTEKEVAEMKSLLEQNLMFLDFKTKFKKALSIPSLESTIIFTEEDYLLFYTLIVCDEDFFSKVDLTVIPIDIQNRTLFEKATLIFLNKLLVTLNHPLSTEEYINIYVKLIRINMSAYYFPEKEVFFTMNYRFDHIRKHYSLELYESFSEFHRSLYHDDEFQIFKSNQNLYYRYLLLLINNLDITHLHAEIKISFSKRESSYLNSFYRKKIQSLTYSPIKFIHEFEEGSEDVDLIISHAYQNKNDANYFIMNNPATPWDWDRLSSELNRIQKLKQKAAPIFS